MASYTHILVALDLSAESQQVVGRVKALFGHQAPTVRVSLLHVQEPLSFAYGGDIPLDLTEIQGKLESEARLRLGEIGGDLGIPANDQHIIMGQPANEIRRFAKDNQVDLIVLGSHGRSGLSLLLGSTANGVLHGAKCDVLAVRIQQTD